MDPIRTIGVVSLVLFVGFGMGRLILDKGGTPHKSVGERLAAINEHCKPALGGAGNFLGGLTGISPGTAAQGVQAAAPAAQGAPAARGVPAPVAQRPQNESPLDVIARTYWAPVGSFKTRADYMRARDDFANTVKDMTADEMYKALEYSKPPSPQEAAAAQAYSVRHCIGLALEQDPEAAALWTSIHGKID